ncbi:hypothetical protein ABK040_016213 [Willaertia magna]
MASTDNTTDNTEYIWRLKVEHGRQIWIPEEYKEGMENTTVEKHLLNKPSNVEHPTYVNETKKASLSDLIEQLDKAVDFYGSVQTEDGHWAGDYGGPMFLLPGIIVVLYASKKLDVLSKPYIYEMIRYIFTKQNEDGGYGLHIEGHSTLFGTTLNYVALRLLGVDASDDRMKKTVEFIRNEKAGVMGCPQWAKLYLCVLGLMDWDCIDPIPPELWLLPQWMPYIQPSKWWCHCRVVYLPMAYIYGSKFQLDATKDKLLSDLRDELYGKNNYDSQPWSKYQSYVNPRDNYHPFYNIYGILAQLLSTYEKYFKFNFLRQSALEKCIDHIKYEDRVTNHICIGPVNKVLNMLSVFIHEGSETEHFKQHLNRIYDYLWLSDDGMKFQGYNGSQLWDTAFATQAICEFYKSKRGDIKKNHLNTIVKAYQFVEYSQVREDVPNRMEYYRHQSKGGWPFSTRDHGWPISDCTAEGMKAVLTTHEILSLYNKDTSILNTEVVNEERLTNAVRVILSMYNGGVWGNGGWATYELQRTHSWIELINPASLYGEIMVDYPHTECTSASITALLHFKKHFPKNEYIPLIDESIKTGLKVIANKQLKEGGWYGGWAVSFCYGTWFAINAIVTASENTFNYENNNTLQRGCDFLVSHQLPDGGWGESYLSCVTHEYHSTNYSQVISTAWALLGLLIANYPNRDVIDRGVKCLLGKQLPNGDFPQENIIGVFNHNCMITYTNYRNIFPIWALSMYAKKFNL